MNITTKAARAKLTARKEPYWTPLRRGCFLGFSPGPSTWHARFRDRAGKQHWNSLGGGMDWAEAKSKAEAWLDLVSTGRRTPSRGTVRSALAAYLVSLRSVGRRSTARDAASTFRLIVDDAFGRMRLEDVTREDVEAWRSRHRPGREPRSLNRYVRKVVAALNCAVEKRGHIGNRDAWELTHLADDNEHESAVFLTQGQRDRLIKAAPKDLRALLTGFGHTGARPSELANATVADFDPKGGTVSVRHKKGKGAQLRVRAVTLSSDGVEFFRSAAKGRAPTAPLLPRADGTPWHSVAWSRGIRAAATAANKKVKKVALKIPEGVSAYSFRHTRISELLQVFGIDPLTVALQTGTSVAMIEKHYFRFVQSSMREKLNAVRQA